METVPSIEVCNDADRQFWTQTIVQASEAGSCIKLPLLAISAYHQSLKDPPNSATHQAFAQKKYMDTLRYIASLQDDVAVISAGELLAVSFLLRTVETFRNDDQAAAVHLQASRKITDAAATSSLESSWVQQTLLPMLHRLEYRSLSPHVLNNGDINAGNGGIERAREKGHAILSWFCHNLGNYQSLAGTKSFRTQAYQTLRNFYAELDEVSQNMEKSRLPINDALYVKIQWLLVKLTLSTLIFTDEVRNDSSTKDFRSLLVLCEKCAHAEEGTNYQSGDHGPPPAVLQISLGMELVATVFLVATWCRDPHVRRRALRFLRSSPRREPRWYSWHAAAIVVWVIRKEEAGQSIRCAADVSLTRRICIERIRYFHDGEKSELALGNPKLSFQTPTWAQISYKNASDSSQSSSQWIELDELDRATSEPNRLADTPPKIPQDLLLSFEVKDPIMPSTAAMLMLAYNRSRNPHGELSTLTCDAVSSKAGVAASESKRTAVPSQTRCVLDENPTTEENGEVPELCSIRNLDPSKLAM